MKWAALLVFSAGLWAQAPAPRVWENTGKPMTVDVQCKEEDVAALDLSCSAQAPCPVFLELTSLETVGSRVFVVGNLHTSSATLFSLLLSGEEEGKSWKEPFERIRAGSLDRIQFFDFERGWISGQIVQGQPRDPFFLVTSDGGKSWRRRPITDESRAGSIEQFWFDSRDHGTVIVDRLQMGENGDRYERYESQTSGESWAVRETSRRPLTIPRMAERPGNPDWRLRPDRATQSYRIERQQAGRWQTVASFLIRTGECKPPEPVEPDAKPPEPEPPPNALPPVEPKTPRKPPTLKRPRP
jgi:photosystem II stability/assembly factor-like uncharacterized protein